MKTKIFAPGDRVAYAATWLKNTGQRTGWAPQARGTVLVVLPPVDGVPSLVQIQWDGRPDPSHVLSVNLTLVSRIAIDAALAG